MAGSHSFYNMAEWQSASLQLAYYAQSLFVPKNYINNTLSPSKENGPEYSMNYETMNEGHVGYMRIWWNILAPAFTCFFQIMVNLPFTVKYKIYFNLDYFLKEQTKKNNGERTQDYENGY